jgi:hypothetical protein
MVERWVLREVAAGAAETCLELRFCERDNPRRQDAPFADSEPRVHAGVPGDPGGPPASYEALAQWIVRTPQSYAKTCVALFRTYR